VLVVGPACVLTHGTAGISFIALQFSSSEAIRTFGEAGLMATMVALLAVLSLVPLLGVLLIRKETSFAVGGRGADIGVEGLRSFCRWVALRMVSHPGLYSLIGLPRGRRFVGHLHQPRAALSAGRPGADKRQAVEASGRLDAKLTGANPIDVLIEFPKGASLYDDQTLATIHEVHAIVETAGRRWQTSGRSIRCAAGSPRRPVRRTLLRSSSMSTSCRSIWCAGSSRRQDACGGVRPHPRRRCEPIAAGGEEARHARSTMCVRPIQGYEIAVTGLSGDCGAQLRPT
jgi:hypothetical protein